MSAVAFKPARTAEDYALCAAIWLSASLKAHDFIPASFWQKHAPAMRDHYLPSARVTMACADGVPVGFCALSGRELAALFVRPDYWRWGIGRRLMERAKAAEVRLELAVYKKNSRALAFYQAEGFRTLGNSICPHSGESELRLVWERNMPVNADECEKFRRLPS